MTSKFTELAIDCGDPAGLARFWCAVLGYEVQDEDDGFIAIGATVVSDNRPEFGWVTLADPEGNEFDVLADRCP
jgi:catechol-2,3-dioxygenase